MAVPPDRLRFFVGEHEIKKEGGPSWLTFNPKKTTIGHADQDYLLFI